jgi:hypothetical protein
MFGAGRAGVHGGGAYGAAEKEAHPGGRPAGAAPVRHERTRAMKRLMLVLVLIAALLGVLAAPASAANPQTLRPPVDTPMFWYGGWYWDYSPVSGDPDEDVTWWQAYDPVFNPDPEQDVSLFYRPVSKDDGFVVFGLMNGVNYGTMRNMPKLFPCTVDVWGPDDPTLLWRHFSPAEVEHYWTGPYLWDEWWSAFIGPNAPFNPKMGAGVYGNALQLPVGPFTTTGTYHVDVNYDQPRPFNDLSATSEWGPSHYPKGLLAGPHDFDVDVVQ